MFGYPTGVGCLLVRNAALARLQRPWFAGGTVNFATVGGRRHILSPGEAGFEDGTLNYFSIAAVEIGLRHLAAAGIDADPDARGLPHQLAARTAGRDATLERTSDGSHLRSADDDDARRDRDDELLRSGGTPARLPARRGAGRSAGRFRSAPAASAIPVPEKRPKGITDEDVAAALARNPDLTLPLFLQMIAARGRQERRRDPRVVRHRQQLRRRASIRRVRRQPARSDASHHRRGELRHRIVPGDSGWLLNSQLPTPNAQLLPSLNARTPKDVELTVQLRVVGTLGRWAWLGNWTLVVGSW